MNVDPLRLFGMKNRIDRNLEAKKRTCYCRWD